MNTSNKNNLTESDLLSFIRPKPSELDDIICVNDNFNNTKKKYLIEQRKKILDILLYTCLDEISTQLTQNMLKHKITGIEFINHINTKINKTSYEYLVELYVIEAMIIKLEKNMLKELDYDTIVYE
jgi:hypothetical protein